MLIDINNLDDGRSIKASFVQEALSTPPEYGLEGNVFYAELEAGITKDGNIYKLKGVLKGRAVFQCAKCLTLVDYPIEIEIDEIFSKLLEGDSDREQDEEVWKFKGTQIDLTQAVLSNILLEMPYKVLCDEDCKGLCPVCGFNLNNGECSCDRSPRDIRFEGLKAFFDNNFDSDTETGKH